MLPSSTENREANDKDEAPSTASTIVLGPAGRLAVSIVSIRFDLGPLAAWGPPDVSMSRLSRFDSIWGLRGPEPRRTSRCLDCLDSAGFGASARWYRYIWYMAYDISIPILPVRSSNLDEAVSVRGLG